MFIQKPNELTFIDAKTAKAFNPNFLPAHLQKSFSIRENVFQLATQYGTPKENNQIVSFCLMLKSGIFVMYDIPKQEVEIPSAFELNISGLPQATRVWDNDELVFTMQWNWRGVFQLGLCEKGSWPKQIRKALARPDLHLI